MIVCVHLGTSAFTQSKEEIIGRIEMNLLPETTPHILKETFKLNIVPAMFAAAPDKLIIPFDMRKRVNELSKMYVWLLTSIMMDHGTERNFASATLKVRISEGYEREDNISFNCTDMLTIRKTEILYENELWGELTQGKVQTSSANNSSREVNFLFGANRNITTAFMERFLMKFQFSTSSQSAHRRVVEFVLTESAQPMRQANQTTCRIEIAMHGTPDDLIRITTPEESCLVYRGSNGELTPGLRPNLNRCTVKLISSFQVDLIVASRQDSFQGGYLKVITNNVGVRLGEVVMQLPETSPLFVDKLSGNVCFKVGDKVQNFAMLKGFKQGVHSILQFDFVEGKIAYIAELVKSLCFQSIEDITYPFHTSITFELFFPEQTSQHSMSRDREPHALRFCTGVYTLPSCLSHVIDRCNSLYPEDLSTPVYLKAFHLNPLVDESALFNFDGGSLTLEIVEGYEVGDTLTLLPPEEDSNAPPPSPSMGKLVFKEHEDEIINVMRSGKQVASYHVPNPGAPLVITFAGRKRGDGRLQMHRQTDTKFTFRQKHLRGLVDSLGIRIGQKNGAISRKVFRLTLEDTYGGISQTVTEIHFHDPNCQTEFVFEDKKLATNLTYRKGNSNLNDGWMSLLPKVELKDDDTEMTGAAGTISIEPCSDITPRDLLDLRDDPKHDLYFCDDFITLGLDEECISLGMYTHHGSRLMITLQPEVSLINCALILRCIHYRYDDDVIPHGLQPRKYKLSFNAGDGVADSELYITLSVDMQLLTVPIPQQVCTYVDMGVPMKVYPIIDINMRSDVSVIGCSFTVTLHQADANDVLQFLPPQYFTIVNDILVVDVRVAREITNRMNLPTAGYSGVVVGHIVTQPSSITVAFDTTLPVEIIRRVFLCVSFSSVSQTPHTVIVNAKLVTRQEVTDQPIHITVCSYPFHMKTMDTPIGYLSKSSFLPVCKGTEINDVHPHSHHGMYEHISLRVFLLGTCTPDDVLKMIPSLTITCPEHDQTILVFKGKEIGTVFQDELNPQIEFKLHNVTIEAIKELLTLIHYKNTATSRRKVMKYIEVQIKPCEHTADLPYLITRRPLCILPRRIDVEFPQTMAFPASIKAKEIFPPGCQLSVEPGDEIIVELLHPEQVPPAVCIYVRTLVDTDRLVLNGTPPDQCVIRKTEIVEKATGMRLAMISNHPDAALTRKITITIPRMGKSLTGSQFVDIIRSISFENKLEAQEVKEESKYSKLRKTTGYAGSANLAKNKKQQKLQQFPVIRVTMEMYEMDTKFHTQHYILIDEGTD
eukprot:PhF_6_TR10567/c0_g1_i2/m.16826